MKDTTKKYIKTALFIIFVPTVIVASYYGVKLGISKFNEYKKKKQIKNETPNAE